MSFLFGGMGNDEPKRKKEDWDELMNASNTQAGPQTELTSSNTGVPGMGLGGTGVPSIGMGAQPPGVSQGNMGGAPVKAIAQNRGRGLSPI